AAFSNRSITVARGNRSLMINRRPRLARSGFQFQIRTSFTLAAAKDCIGRIFQSATGFINPLTLERHGCISGCATVSRLRNWLSIQKIPIGFLLQLPDTPMDLTRNAAFIDRSMAEKHSKTYFIGMRTSARAMCRSIRAIRRLFMLRCGNRAKAHGKTEYSTATVAAFLNPPTAAKHGDN